MDIKNILKHVDHTLLSQTSTEEEIINVCNEGIKYSVAAVCIPPCFVKAAFNYLQGRLHICTVIGFPNGYSTTETKCFETENALKNGANEIDMVINIGLVKEHNYKSVENEIKKIKNICGKNILKVIIETCLLNNEEKINLCRTITQSGADFIKTSTGFSKSGAKIEDIELIRKNIGDKVKIKAAGGINSFEDASEFLSMGVERLGSSRLIKIAEGDI